MDGVIYFAPMLVYFNSTTQNIFKWDKNKTISWKKIDLKMLSVKNVYRPLYGKKTLYVHTGLLSERERKSEEIKWRDKYFPMLVLMKMTDLIACFIPSVEKSCSRTSVNGE